jgi:hypothetical protein
LSNSPQSPEESVTFFLDRTHQSKYTEKLLRLLGVKVELHKKHFVQDAPDTDWIPVCAGNGWIIVTGDKGIENDGINRAAVIRCGAKIFMLHDHRTRGLEQTASLIAARKKIARTALNNVGPFYCPVQIANDDHVGEPKFYPGGHPIEVGPVVPTSEPAKDEATKKPAKLNKQKSEHFEFD